MRVPSSRLWLGTQIQSAHCVVDCSTWNTSLDLTPPPLATRNKYRFTWNSQISPTKTTCAGFQGTAIGLCQRTTGTFSIVPFAA